MEVNIERNFVFDKDIKRLGIYNLFKEEVLKSFGDCLYLYIFYCFGEGIDFIIIYLVIFNFFYFRVLNLGFMELDRVFKVVGELI